MENHSSFLAWRIPWTEKPGGYSPWGRRELDMTEATEHGCMHSLLGSVSKCEFTYCVSKDLIFLSVLPGICLFHSGAPNRVSREETAYNEHSKHLKK